MAPKSAHRQRNCQLRTGLGSTPEKKTLFKLAAKRKQMRIPGSS